MGLSQIFNRLCKIEDEKSETPQRRQKYHNAQDYHAVPFSYDSINYNSLRQKYHNAEDYHAVPFSYDSINYNSYARENFHYTRPNTIVDQSEVYSPQFKGSSDFVQENAPQNGCRTERIDARQSSNRGKFEERERKERKVFKLVVEPSLSNVRWIKYYSSDHNILLVGEGDFSFSTCLAKAFGRASNMVATSLNSQGFLMRNYRNALSNIVELSIRNCKVIHEIDATEIATYAFLGGIKFDRIIFNFPFAGFNKDLPRENQIRLHRRLVILFLENAKELVSENGEIHISHKTNGFHGEWKLEELASSHMLRLIEAVDFNHHDYPGYNTKCGFGGDNNFDCYPSKTYKFGLMLKKKSTRKNVYM